MTAATTIEITPLMLACQNGNLDDIKAMLTKGASVEAKDSNGRTALFYCAENLETDCVEELLKHKANVNHQDKDGYSCLHLAVICGNLTIVEYLVEHGADINMTDSEMHSAAHWSVVCGQESILDFLLLHNADPETADIHGAYPIHYAAQMCGHIDVWDESINRDPSKSLIILRKLIQQKVKIDAEDFDQRNAIIWAASSGSSEALLELFAAGGDPNKHEKDGLTALHCASSRNHLDCIRVLIENCKTSVDIMDNNNCTPIFYAATLGQLDACNLLIKYGANLHVQDCKGRTVYHCAAAKGQLKCLKTLCKQNSSIWLRNRRGDYPIHEAYYNRQMECLYYLLDAIGDKRAAKSSNMYDGRTMLHLAAADNDLKLCKRLVADGVDVNCLMKTSPTTYMTPYDVAVIKNASECARYLKSVGGIVGQEIVSRLQTTKANNSKSKIGDDGKTREAAAATKPNKNKEAVSSGEDAKMTNRKEKLRSNEKTTLADESSTDEIKKAMDDHDDNIEFIRSEESGTDEDDYDDQDERERAARLVQQHRPQAQPQAPHPVLNKRPIIEQRHLTKSNITESHERQKKRDAVLAAQMAQAQAERERRRRAREQEDARREERAQQKMNNLNSLYTQVKSKSTVSRKTDKSAKKDSNPERAAAAHKSNNGGGSFLPSLMNDSREGTKKTEETASRKKHQETTSKSTQARGQQNESEETTTGETEGVVRSKYAGKGGAGSYESDEEEIEYVDKTKSGATVARKSQPNTRSRAVRPAGAAPFNMASKPTSKKKIENRLVGRDKKKQIQLPNGDDDDDYEDMDDETCAELGHKNERQLDTSDNTSVNERTPRNKSELGGGSKTPRKRYLDLPSPSRSRQRSKSKNFDINLDEGDENLVRLVIKPDTVSSNPAWARKRYASLFDKQRLILKSLYEIRRCRINNRDIVVSADLNNMLIKNYDYDIRKNCQSLRDLEKVLEMIAVEISDEYRKNSKRSHTLLTFKARNSNGQMGPNAWRSTENMDRIEDRKRPNDFKSKSQMGNDLSPAGDSTLRFRQERLQNQNDHLKVAYRSLLPNDIYRQYYNTNLKYSNGGKEQPAPAQKEKSILLPVISQKPGFTT